MFSQTPTQRFGPNTQLSQISESELKMVLWSVFIVLLAWSPLSKAACPVADANKCSCSDAHLMDCDGRGLTTIPNFILDHTITELHLEDNRIENITTGAFRKLQSLKKLILRNNSIMLIEPNAFSEIKGLLDLDLSSNLLTDLPAAIAELESLQSLDVSKNPIDENHFTNYIMYSIGDTLEVFTFGSPDVMDWPITLRHLQNLMNLHVIGGSFYTMPPDAFHGFEGTLLELTVENTNLIAIPIAISNLRWLSVLHFDHNHFLGDSGVLIPSFGNRELLPRLQKISLVDDNLTVFPSLLKYLKNVDTLILDSNRLAFVSDTSVQVAVGTKVKSLSLRNCSLSRVPGALSKLTNLTVLNLADNNIHSFENNDFDSMQKLENLTISNNPLEYIANETFKDLHAMKILNLKDTKIKTIPEAIRFLRTLQDLQFPQDSIECTCNVAWLKEFIDTCNPHLQIGGTCETIISSIESYLQVHIPHCPNFRNNTSCT